MVRQQKMQKLEVFSHIKSTVKKQRLMLVFRSLSAFYTFQSPIWYHPQQADFPTPGMPRDSLPGDSIPQEVDS